MNQNDLRWRRTSKKIQLGLIKELTNKDFNHLTVAGLIKAAGISRRAFYLHYIDKFDLLNQTEEVLITKLKIAFADDHQHFLTHLDNQSDLWQQNYLFITNVLTLINQEREIFRVLISSNGDPKFTQQLRKLLSKEIDNRIKLYHAHFSNQIPQEYAKVLIVGEIIDLVTTWLNSPHPVSITNFAKILTASQLIAPLNLLEQD